MLFPNYILHWFLVALVIIDLIVSTTGLVPLVPEPAGPFYGFPYNTKDARRLPIPGSAHGTCQVGKVYRITSPADLRKYDSELQCIFTAGITPSKVPEGPQPGRVLLALNARHFLINPIVHALWRGNFAFKAECNRNDTEQAYIGFHNSFNRAVLPTILYVAPLLKTEHNFAPGEYEDQKPSVIMDFTKNLRKRCPDYPQFVARNRDKLPTPVKTLVNIYPQTQIIDVFRLVGRQNDGAKIFLGKTYFKDYFRSDNQIASIAFWYVISYDPEVNPEFKMGQELPPQECSYQYTFPGVVDIVLRYLGVDNILYNPTRTFWRTGGKARVTLRDLGLSFREYLSHTGRRWRNRWKLRAYFRSASPRRINNSQVYEYPSKPMMNQGSSLEDTTLITGITNP